MSSEDKYEREITEASNQIILRTATKSRRVGKSRARDTIVFGKMVWGEAFSYISPLQTAIIFTALITPAIITVNRGLYEFQSQFGISQPFQFPINLISIMAVIALIIIFIFGLISVRHIGTYRTTNEWSQKMNPGTRLLWEKQEETLRELKEVKEFLKGKK